MLSIGQWSRQDILKISGGFFWYYQPPMLLWAPLMNEKLQCAFVIAMKLT